MKRVLGMGNALVDILIRVSSEDILTAYSLPKGSMQLIDRELSDRIMSALPIDQMKLVSGGSAANTIHGLARLGIPTGYVGSIGTDELGDFFRKDMAEENIQPVLFESELATGRAITFITPDSERTFATYLGAASSLSPGYISPALFHDYDVFYMEGYLVQDQALVEKAMDCARQLGLKIALDMASYNVVEANREYLTEIIGRYVDIVFANQEEARALTGMGLEESLQRLSEMCNITVIKTGENGSVVRNEGRDYYSRALPVTPVDTTGAGDLYASGFLYGLIMDYPLELCADLGSLLAGNIIGVIGTKMDNYRWSAIEKQIKKMKPG